MLAGTTAQSSHGDAQSGFNLMQGRDSDAGNQDSERNTVAEPQDQTQDEADLAQSAAARVTSRSNTVQASAPLQGLSNTAQSTAQQPVRSNASSVRPTAGCKEAEPQQKTTANATAAMTINAQPAPVVAVQTTALPVATPPEPTLPVTTLPVSGSRTTAPPVTAPPVATSPVPSPGALAQSANPNEAQKDQASTGSVEAKPQGENSRSADGAAHDADSGQNAPTVPAARDASQASHPSESADDAPIQSDNPLASSTTCVTGFSLPAGITPISLSLSSMTLSSTGFLPGVGDGSQLNGSIAESGKASTGSVSKFTPALSAPSQTTSSTVVTNAPAHAVQNTTQSGPTTQHAQNQTAQAAPATQGQANAAIPTTPQIQGIAAHATPHETVVAHGSADGAGDVAHAAQQPAHAEANETAATQGINTANVIQKMNGTEMRVGMHSAEFGEISIRTSVSQQQMTAQISVEDGDLGKAISAHIPAMEAKIGGESGLRALVEVSQSGMSFSGERNSSPQREQGPYAQPAQVESTPVFAEPDATVARIAAVSGNESGNAYRLDIRA